MIEVDDHRDGALFSVRVQPGARREAIIGPHGGMVKIAVREPPERGKANVAVVCLLSQYLDLPKSRVEILSGETSRTKRILVRDVTAKSLVEKLRDLPDAS